MDISGNNMGQSNNNGVPPWLISALGIGGGLGQAGGGLWNIFGNQTNPADAANKRIGEIPGKTEDYYSPYMNAGKGAMESLQNQNKNLLSGETQNQLGASYKQSPGYQQRLKDAMTLAQGQSARGGYTGTPMDTNNLLARQEALSQDDYQKYLQNQIGLYNTGYGGEQDLNHQGFEANKGMADIWGSTLGQQGAYDYAGQAGKNKRQSQGMSDLFSGLGTAGATAAFGPAGGLGFEALMKLFHGQGGQTA